MVWALPSKVCQNFKQVKITHFDPKVRKPPPLCYYRYCFCMLLGALPLLLLFFDFLLFKLFFVIVACTFNAQCPPFLCIAFCSYLISSQRPQTSKASSSWKVTFFSGLFFSYAPQVFPFCSHVSLYLSHSWVSYITYIYSSCAREERTYVHHALHKLLL